MCSIDDCDPCDIYREQHRTAAKPHKCYECGRVIGRGERHLYCTMLYDESWETFRMCAHCEVGADWLRKVCGGFSWGIVRDEVAEHWVEEPMLRSVGLGRFVVLSGEARTSNSVVRVAQWRRPDGTLVPVPKPIPVPELAEEGL